MKLVGGSKFLGLSLGDRSIGIAEVRIRRDQPAVQRTAEFEFPADVGWDKPAPLGEALRRFLVSNHFSASHAVAGVPARWLMARQKDVPPSTPATAASILRLQAERDFPPELKDMIFDYAGAPHPAEPRKVLVVAMPRAQLDQVEEMADSAGLSVRAITASSLVLSEAIGTGADDGLSLVLGADAAELASREAPRVLQYLPVGALVKAGDECASAAVSALGGEVQRAVLRLSMGAGAATRKLWLWDGIGVGPDVADLLGQRTGLDVCIPNGLPRLGLNGGASFGKFSAAVALAVAGANPGSLPINLLTPRLAAPKTRRFGRRTLLMAAAAVVLAGLIGWLVYDVGQLQATLNDMQVAKKDREPNVKAAESMAKKVAFARTYFEGRPTYLMCMRDLAKAFPQQGSIFVTNLTMRENHKGTLTGKAHDQAAILTVMDELKKNRSFGDVKLLDMREAGGRSREISFSMSFTYNAVE